MTEGRKIVAILVADVVGYSRLMGADEEGTLARLGALRREVFDPTVTAHGGRVVKRTGDGAIVEFRSVVEAARCAIAARSALAERNAALPPEQRIEMRIGIHLGDVIEAADGDLYGDAVNIAARLEGICAPGAICLSEDAWRHVRDRLPETFVDRGEQQLKNIIRPMRVYELGGSEVIPPTVPGPGETPPPQTTEGAHGFPAAVTSVLQKVARIKEAYLADVPENAATWPSARGLRGVKKVARVLERVERIVDAVSDPALLRDAGPSEPPAPPRPPTPEIAGVKATPDRPRHRNVSGVDDESTS